MEHFSSFSVSSGQIFYRPVGLSACPIFLFLRFLSISEVRKHESKCLTCSGTFLACVEVFYEPIFWLVGLYVNLSPVNVFAFLSSLKVDT